MFSVIIQIVNIFSFSRDKIYWRYLTLSQWLQNHHRQCKNEGVWLCSNITLLQKQAVSRIWLTVQIFPRSFCSRSLFEVLPSKLHIFWNTSHSDSWPTIIYHSLIFPSNLVALQTSSLTSSPSTTPAILFDHWRPPCFSVPLPPQKKCFSLEIST